MRLAKAITSSANQQFLGNLALTALKLVLLLGFLALCASLFSGGSLTRAILVLLLVSAPMVAYVGIKWPLVFPFALYVFLVPLNDILYWQQFGTLSKALGGMSFFALAIWLIRNRTAVTPPLTLAVWFGLTLWMIMTGMWALQRADWWGLLPTFLQLFCLYIIINLMPVRAVELRSLWLAIIAGGVCAAAVGMYDFFKGNGFYAHRLYVATAAGDTVDPNHFAGALLLPICVTTAAALGERRRLFKAGLALCFCALMVALYLSGSRDALLAICIAFVYLLWKTKHRRQLGWLMAVAGLAAIPLWASIAARFSDAASSGGAGRLYIWQVGWDSLKHYWLLGAGLGNFPNAFYQFYTEIYTKTPMGWPRAGHNLLLTSAVELGLFGAALMFAAWLSQFLMLRKIAKTSPFYEPRIALEAALIAVFISSLFLDNMFRKYTWLVFCAMVLLRSRYITELNETPSALNIVALASSQKSKTDFMQGRSVSDAGHKIPLP